MIYMGILYSSRWRPIAWGLFLQFIFGLLILRWEVGAKVFGCIGQKTQTFLSYTDHGSGFVYGYLVSQTPFNLNAENLTGTAYQVAEDLNKTKAFNGIFMFQVLSVIFFFSFITSMAFYLGWMQWLVSKVGWFFQITIGTTPCESMNAAANIILGMISLVFK